MPDSDNWHWAMMVHGDVFDLGLSHHELMAYTYLNGFCHKAYPISLLLMSKRLHVDTKRLKRAIDNLIARKMVVKISRKGHAATYQITTMRIKGWGQMPLWVGSNAPTPLGSNAPTGQGQTHLLTSPLETDPRSLDHTFLEIFQAHFKLWQFTRKPLSGPFIFNLGMQAKALQCMRYIHRNLPGYSTRDAFEKLLAACGEYLALDRDVINHPKDLRALSPGRWLNDWADQIRFAGIYLEEKGRKITRIEEGLPPG